MKSLFTHKYLLLLAGLFCSSLLFSQKGAISGKVVDKTTGEALIGALVEVRQHDAQITGAATDFDGNYSIPLDPGTYELVINYLSYATDRISDVTVTAKEVTP